MNYVLDAYDSEIEKAKKLGIPVYAVRSCDDDDTMPATIEPTVRVNRYGAIITSEKLNFGPHGFIEFDKFEKDNNQVSSLEEILKLKVSKNN